MSDQSANPIPEDEPALATQDEIVFRTCDIERCRLGIRNALKAALRLIQAGKQTISCVLAPRYGKSHFMRQLSMELIEQNIAGACVVLAPWLFLRDQLNEKKKIDKMVEHHAIDAAALRTKAIICDILTGKIDPEFYTAAPRRHWWGMTIAQAYAAQARTVLLDLAVQFKLEKRPLVIFIDESHLLSTGDYGWGGLAAELKAAGAVIILLTGTPERPDNITAFGFEVKETDRRDFKYKNFIKINDEDLKIEYIEAQKAKYKVIPDLPMVGLQQAWKEKALTKMQHRLFTFKSDGEKLEFIGNRKARRALGAALRDQETIRIAVREMQDELRLRRLTDGAHGPSAPTTAAVVFVGNDRYDDDGNDWHAREVKRIIKEEWPNFLPGNAKVQITTRFTEGNDSEKAAESIKDFVDGIGDVIIVKQMGGVGLEAERLKVGLDLSTIRTHSNTTQRWLRLATLWEDVTHGTMILPNDPITMQLWHDIVEEQGGQYTIENAVVIDSKIVKAKDNVPEPKPVISDRQRAGSIDQDLRLVEADLDQKLDAILAKSPIFAVRFTRRELADEYEKGMFRDVDLNVVNAGPAKAPVFDATTEVAKSRNTINKYTKRLADRETPYGVSPEQNEVWINQRKRWMSEAKNYANIRGELNSCRDLDKLKKAEEWLEAQLNQSV